MLFKNSRIMVFISLLVLMGSTLLIGCNSSDDETLPSSSGGAKILTNNAWQPVFDTQEINGYTVTLVLVPAGCFMMGSSDGNSDERESHEICFDEPFYIDQYEVSNEQFNALEGQAARSSSWTDSNLPRENIRWDEARDFCKENRGARLPTEAEWEYAARGPENWIYPWGNEFDRAALNCELVVCWSDGYDDKTAPIGTYETGKSWVDAYDLSGNVQEWVSTIYDQDVYPYPYATADGRETTESFNTYRVTRGGSWSFGSGDLRSADRFGHANSRADSDLGFRCVSPYLID